MGLMHLVIVVGIWADPVAYMVFSLYFLYCRLCHGFDMPYEVLINHHAFYCEALLLCIWMLQTLLRSIYAIVINCQSVLPNQVVSLHCLLAYAAMDDAAGGEADVRNVLIIPAVRKLLSAIPASSDVNLLYKKLYDGLKKECAFFMELIHHQHAGTTRVLFIEL